MKIFKFIKKFGRIFVVAGVSFVVKILLTENISKPKGVWKGLLLKVGVASIAGFAAKKVADSFEDDVDKFEDEAKDVIKEIKHEIDLSEGKA